MCRSCIPGGVRFEGAKVGLRPPTHDRCEVEGDMIEPMRLACRLGHEACIHANKDEDFLSSFKSFLMVVHLLFTGAVRGGLETMSLVGLGKRD